MAAQDIGHRRFAECLVSGIAAKQLRQSLGHSLSQPARNHRFDHRIVIGFDHVEFREGLAEDLPIETGWADVVISNGVINLCADKRVVFREIHRVLRPGGHLEFADIANGRPVPEAAIQNIDLWTA